MLRYALLVKNMSKEKLYFFNTLPNLYEALKKEHREQYVRDSVKDFLQNSFNVDLPKKVTRFLQIPSVSFIPAGLEYFRHYAELIQLYTNGLFYSAIVLSGVLCERICYDILTTQEIRLGKNEPLSQEQIAQLFEMNLYDLIILLHKWNLIKEPTKNEMIKVNNKRNEYVHPKKSKLNDKKDTLEMIERITRILKNELLLL